MSITPSDYLDYDRQVIDNRFDHNHFAETAERKWHFFIFLFSHTFSVSLSPSRHLTKPFWHNVCVCFFFFDSTENWSQVPNVCRYFLNGNCRFGEFCRNSHAIQPNDGTITSQPIAHQPQDDTNNNRFIESNEPARSWIDAPVFIPRYITQNSTCEISQTNDEDEGASR